MKVLITGGAGFIGLHTAVALIKGGCKVVLMDNLSEPVHPADQKPYIPPGAQLEIGDVRDRWAWERLASDVDVIYHFAARQDYLLDFSNFFDVNVTGTALMYEVIIEKRLPVRKIIVASSQAVYGEGLYLRPDGSKLLPEMRSRAQLDHGQWEVTDPFGPIRPAASSESMATPKNQYALSKYFQESTALVLGRRFSIPTTCLRYSIVQGPGQSFWNAYSGACRLFSLAYHFGSRPRIFEDGLQTRDFVNIEDVVEANLLVLDSAKADYQVFNVGGERPYSVLELASIAARVYDKEPEISLGQEYRFGDTRHLFSDSSKLRGLGWRPKRDPEYSLRCYRDWIQSMEASWEVIAQAYEQMKKIGVISTIKGKIQ